MISTQAGYSPFADPVGMDQVVICKNIINGKLVFPKRFARDAQDLVKKLLNRNPVDRLGANYAQSPIAPNSTAGLGGPDQTSEFSSSVTSTSIRPISGRIDCSHRVLEAQQKALRRNGRMRAH